MIADIAVVGAGAAGLFAATWAGRRAHAGGSRPTILALDGAAKLGAKVLVAGGGRCNVTHHAVSSDDFAGSTPGAVRAVLARWSVADTVAFFADLGVPLKREPTGKLFPVSDDAHSVLDALLRAARAAGARLAHPWRVASVSADADGLFDIRRDTARDADTLARHPAGPDADPVLRHDRVLARRLILATGGMALPRSGSDGGGYAIASALGHSITEHVRPALVPLILADAPPASTPNASAPPNAPAAPAPPPPGVAEALRSLSGVAAPATLRLHTGSGKRTHQATGPLLCTHFGLSGPAALDISRHLTHLRHTDAGAHLRASFLPALTTQAADAMLLTARALSPLRALCVPPHALPERLVRALCALAGAPPAEPMTSLTKPARRALAAALTDLPLPVTGDRGFTHAETTAGGVPLAELHLATMASRAQSHLFVCGELCDVDGRIGGFNFQWAWASGHLAGVAAASSLAQ
ncbi:MAG: aminoacetone oxidase family FAD-binding enzyme [Planctomyces sp.]|nr:aminoacetone oxidase family FAD-binding enzyme [Planctomyces sp.]